MGRSLRRVVHLTNVISIALFVCKKNDHTYTSNYTLHTRVSSCVLYYSFCNCCSMTWYTGLSIEVSEAKSLEPGLLLQASSLNTYCGVTVDNTKICRTATKYHTSTPLWTEEFYFHCPQKGFHHLTFTVTHDDAIKSRKLGRLILSWDEIVSRPINGWQPLYEVRLLLFVCLFMLFGC